MELPCFLVSPCEFMGSCSPGFPQEGEGCLSSGLGGQEGAGGTGGERMQGRDK